jgi:DNA-binding CsgD family transcriptional regulator
MLNYLVCLIFILSVALAAGGIAIASKVREKYRHEAFSTLLYFQVFIFTFGFYGIWGQVVITAFLSPYISPDLLIRIADISMLIGLPFVVFGWLMLIRFSLVISGRKTTNWFVLWFLLINFSIIVLVGFYVASTNNAEPLSLIKQYFISMNFFYSTLASLIIFLPLRGRSVIYNGDKKIISPALIIIMLAQIVPLLFYTSQLYLALIFILTFFAGNTFLPLYFNYGTTLPAMISVTEINISFEEFCKRFEISPRETDIVKEIYNGLSNKEISDKLFIGLQTVKDHTHRIYIKTNVRSRVQLMNLVKGFTES